jgi:hypothetical protein
LNLSQTGKTWPEEGAEGDERHDLDGAPARAREHRDQPFAASPSSVRSAARRLPLRKTFVAPMFPEP